MIQKHSNLCIAADMSHVRDIISLLEKIGDKIIILKIHCDIVNDWSDINCFPLFSLARQKQVLLWEDRKFADISHIVSSQYLSGFFKIASWANLVSVHTNAGLGILEAFPQNDPLRGVLLVDTMSSEENSESSHNINEYLTSSHKCVVGVISQNRDPKLEAHYLCVIPGIHLEQTDDGKNQKYRTPSQAIFAGADIIVVGRGICGAQHNVIQVTERYRQAGLGTSISIPSEMKT